MELEIIAHCSSLKKSFVAFCDGNQIKLIYRIPIGEIVAATLGEEFVPSG